jgi:hypothetical protein
MTYKLKNLERNQSENTFNSKVIRHTSINSTSNLITSRKVKKNLINNLNILLFKKC